VSKFPEDTAWWNYTDGDGTREARDYVLATNAAGWLMIYDASNRQFVTQVRRIALPGPASAIAVDREARKVWRGRRASTCWPSTSPSRSRSTPTVTALTTGDDRGRRRGRGFAAAGAGAGPGLRRRFPAGSEPGDGRRAAALPGDGRRGPAGRWREVGALAPFGVPTGPEAGAGTPDRPRPGARAFSAARQCRRFRLL
jgi:hypothetical protein